MPRVSGVGLSQAALLGYQCIGPSGIYERLIMTSSQLELLYTIAADNLDALLAVGAISKERYDSRMARLGRWIEAKYSEAS